LRSRPVESGGRSSLGGLCRRPSGRGRVASPAAPAVVARPRRVPFP
jgi:hypothetical protein